MIVTSVPVGTVATPSTSGVAALLTNGRVDEQMDLAVGQQGQAREKEDQNERR